MTVASLKQQLKKNEFFLHPYTNKIGLELLKYLTSTDYYDLINPEPANQRKNSIEKVFFHLRVIDRHVQKPLNKYDKRAFMAFMEAVRDDKVVRYHTRVKWGQKGGKAGVTSTSATPLGTVKPHTLKQYVMEFKRFWRIYRQYELHNNKRFNQKRFEWGMNLRPLKIKTVYEDYPYLTPQQLVNFSRALKDEEYMVRTLLSVNLMGRKCEMNELTLKHFDKREDGVYIKLPDIKLHSANKVHVQVFNFVEQELKPYLEKHQFKTDEPIFSTKDTAFAKALKRVSERELKSRITPKTLRKLGVCIAEQLGYEREEVERIGGWAPNSPVLIHYFKRRGVSAKKANRKADETLNKDLSVEVDQLRAQTKKMAKDLELLKDVVEKKLDDSALQAIKRLVSN